MTGRSDLGQTCEPAGQDTVSSGLAGVVLGDPFVGLDRAGIGRTAGLEVRVALHPAELRCSTAQGLRRSCLALEVLSRSARVKAHSEDANSSNSALNRSGLSTKGAWPTPP
jgi:hypothetical protein